MDIHFILAIFHLLFVVPLFLFIGFQRSSTPTWLYHSILALGAFILLYHGYKLVVRMINRSGYAWVNAIHVFLTAPLLMYIGYYQKDTPRSAYELLLLLGFAAAGYHTLTLVQMVNSAPETKEK